MRPAAPQWGTLTAGLTTSNPVYEVRTTTMNGNAYVFGLAQSGTSGAFKSQLQIWGLGTGTGVTTATSWATVGSWADATTIASATPATDFQVVGNYAYVADGSNGLQIISLTPAGGASGATWATATVGSLGTSAGITSAYGVNVVGNTAIISGNTSTLTNALTRVDASNPASPVVLGSVQLNGGTGTAQYLDMSGAYAYVADGTGGLQSVKLSTWGYILNFNIFTDSGVLLPNTFTYIYLGAGF